jgi:hypothetical protein
MLSRSTIERSGLDLRGNTTASFDIDSFQFPMGLFTLGYLLVFNCWPVSLFHRSQLIEVCAEVSPFCLFVSSSAFHPNRSLGFLKRYP